MAPTDPAPAAPLSRREFLEKAAITAAVGTAGVTLGGCEGFHLKELAPDRIEAMLKDLEREYGAQYGKEVTVGNQAALPDTLFAYALDISRCIGCRRCVYACVDENNQSRDPQVHWIKVLRMKKEEGVHLMEGELYYDPEKVPEEGYFYVPVACQQ